VIESVEPNSSFGQVINVSSNVFLDLKKIIQVFLNGALGDF
jgi:hypothetical protein